MIDRLSTLHAYGRTALYTAIMDGLLMITKGCGANKALLVITDGIDNASGVGIDQVKAEARKASARIFGIGIGKSNLATASWLSGLGDLEGVDMKTLTMLADETEGEAFWVQKIGDSEVLTKTIMTVADKIGDRFIVGFVSAASPGEVRIQLLNHKDSVLRIEDGQMAVMNASTVLPQSSSRSK